MCYHWQWHLCRNLLTAQCAHTFTSEFYWICLRIKKNAWQKWNYRRAISWTKCSEGEGPTPVIPLSENKVRRRLWINKHTQYAYLLENCLNKQTCGEIMLLITEIKNIFTYLNNLDWKFIWIGYNYTNHKLYIFEYLFNLKCFDCC